MPDKIVLRLQWSPNRMFLGNSEFCYFMYLVPGVVTDVKFSEMPTGIRLTWSPPDRSNGVILYYKVSYQRLGAVESTTLSSNTTTTAATGKVK